ncbi:hypothetical protein FRB94_004845 [Tulasnella sp. JGI-2019a]|nr:hypothetical protein FRB94_004845 [Tulasnella sp. JGI-2019a]
MLRRYLNLRFTLLLFSGRSGRLIGHVDSSLTLFFVLRRPITPPSPVVLRRIFSNSSRDPSCAISATVFNHQCPYFSARSNYDHHNRSLLHLANSPQLASQYLPIFVLFL